MESLVIDCCFLLGRSSANGDRILCDNAEIFSILGVIRRNSNKNMFLYSHFRCIWTTRIDGPSIRIPTKSKDVGKTQRVTELLSDFDKFFCVFVTVTQMDRAFLQVIVEHPRN